MEALQGQLAAVVAELEASVGVDPGIIARFDKLSNEVCTSACHMTHMFQVESMLRTVTSERKELCDANNDINRILVTQCLSYPGFRLIANKSNFDPALDILVDVVNKKFAAAFEREWTRDIVQTKLME